MDIPVERGEEDSLGLLEIAIIAVIIILWIWGIIDVLRSNFSGPGLARWTAVILIFPVAGFIAYILFGKPRIP